MKKSGVLILTAIILFSCNQKRQGEIAAWIAEHCFGLLDAPVMRCASLDTPIPFSIELENNFMAKARLDEMVKKLVAF